MRMAICNDFQAWSKLIRLLTSFLWLACSASCYWGGDDEVEPLVPRTSSKPPRVPLGLNLGSLNYYSPTVPFVDAMKNANEPETTNATGDGPWNTELIDVVPLRPDGYPLEIPYSGPGVTTPQWVRYAVVRLIYGGRYTLLYDGDGTFEMPTVPVEVASRQPGVIEFDAPVREGPLFLTITRSSREDPVRNLRLILPGFSAGADPNDYHPKFIEQLRGASVLRFMDWQRTNDSALARWKDRATPEGSQATWRGAAFETMIDLANHMKADPWLCVPHLADDHFVEQLATLVRDRLQPGRVLYIEYSNELWNGIFSQAEYVADEGCRQGLQKLPPEPGSCSDAAGRMWAGTKYVARRSAQIFEIFERVFGGSERLVRVLGGQAAGVGRNAVLLEAFNDPALNPRGVRADALAIAPYFGSVVGELTRERSVSSLSVEMILQRAEESIRPEVGELTRDNKKLADRYGLRLVGYEGGQHLVASGEHANDEALTDKLIAANRHARMGELYEKMFDTWYEASGNELLVLFNSAELPGKHGAWGLLESPEQSPERAPKYRAYRERLTELAERAR